MKHTIRIIPTFLIPVLVLTIYGPYALARDHEAGSMTSSMHYKRSQAETAKTPDTGKVLVTRGNQDNAHELNAPDGVSEQAVQEALLYYPLQIGDEWQYHYLYFDTQAGDSGYVNVNVTGDTLMSNHHRYQILKYHYFKQIDSQGTLKSDTVKYYYERVDSSTANVYRKSYSGEVLRDSLMIQKGDSIGNGFESTTCYDTTSWKVFGSIRQVKLMRWWTGIMESRSYSMVKGIGITRNFYNAGTTNGDLDTLIYAKINGKEYGHFVDTPIQKTPSPNLPSSLKLYQNYPNPFNPSTIIRWQLAMRSRVTLTIYDVTGREITTLVHEEEPAGVHKITFNAGKYNLSSGVYFARLKVLDKNNVRNAQTIKLTVLK